jgi:uncharacterized Tic20 family protein
METQMQAASQPQATSANKDDRIWVAIVHGSAFLVFFGPIIAVILWFTHRKKSAYVAFQALQAMVYQSLFFWTWVLLIPLLVIVLMVIMVFVMALLIHDRGNGFLIGFLPQLVIWGTMLGTFLVYAGIGLWGAISSLQGRDFRYPFFGDRLARHLEYHGAETVSLPEDKEDQVIGAVCHSTGILMLWGLATPIVVWITQHERSMFLRFQALQALIYQAIGLLAYFAFFMLYMVFIFGFMDLLMFTGGSGSSTPPTWLGIALLPFLAFICVFMLGGLAYPLLAFVAAVRVLKGHDFHYPILGNILGNILASKLKPVEAK